MLLMNCSFSKSWYNLDRLIHLLKCWDRLPVLTTVKTSLTYPKHRRTILKNGSVNRTQSLELRLTALRLCWWLITVSCHFKNDLLQSSWERDEFTSIEHALSRHTRIGIFRAECTVWPSSKSWMAITTYATVSTSTPLDLTNFCSVEPKTAFRYHPVH